MNIDVLVTNQLNLFIVFHETYGQPERRLCPLVVPYMAPGPSVQFFLIRGSYFVIWLARGMGPLLCPLDVKCEGIMQTLVLALNLQGFSGYELFVSVTS